MLAVWEQGRGPDLRATAVRPERDWRATSVRTPRTAAAARPSWQRVCGLDSSLVPKPRPSPLPAYKAQVHWGAGAVMCHGGRASHSHLSVSSHGISVRCGHSSWCPGRHPGARPRGPAVPLITAQTWPSHLLETETHSRLETKAHACAAVASSVSAPTSLLPIWRSQDRPRVPCSTPLTSSRAYL